MTIREQMNLQARVNAGATLLDENRPGWANEIDLDILHLTSTTHCILGQLYREYMNGIEELGIITGLDYGFCAHWSYEYPTLTEMWRDTINKRRGA